MDILKALVGGIGLAGTVLALVTGSIAQVVSVRISAKEKKELSPGDLFIAALFAGFIIVLPGLGGFIWNLTCKIFNLPYMMGGPGNEPKGIHAFIWGFSSCIILGAFARMVTSDYQFRKIKDCLKWFRTGDALYVLCYGVLLGIGGFLFYNLRISNWISSFGFTEENSELLTVVIWAVILSSFSSLAAVWARQKSRVWISYIVALPVTIFLCICALVTYYYAYVPAIDSSGQVKGLAAGYTLRLGLMFSLLLQLHPTILERYLSMFKGKWDRLWNKKLEAPYTDNVRHLQ